MKSSMTTSAASAVILILAVLVVTTDMNPASLWLLIASTLAYASTDRDRGCCCVSRWFRRA
jgi:hypothetical protein